MSILLLFDEPELAVVAPPAAGGTEGGDLPFFQWWVPRTTASRVLLASALVPYRVDASSAAVGHPATNLRRYDEPGATWRSSGAAAQTLWLDLGLVPSPVAGVALEGANGVFLVVVQGSHDRQTVSAPLGDVPAPLLDPTDGRWKAYITLARCHYRYLRLALSLPPGAHFELATVALCYPVAYLSEFAARRELNAHRREPHGAVPLAHGGVEVVSHGRAGADVTLDLQGPLSGIRGGARRPAALRVRHEVACVEQTTPGDVVVLYENAGDPSRVYFATRLSESQLAETYPVIEGQVVFREVA